MADYWVVGAMFGGRDDQLPLFVEGGYWVLGWTDWQQPDQAWRRDQMKPRDRIAVKRMLGSGATEIEIRALGIIKGLAGGLDENGRKRVLVNRVITEMERRVAHNGCTKSIHGPYGADDPWVKDVFLL